MSDYNKHYQKENYFGESYPELIKFISRFDKSSKILDLGCGQGRDVLSLGRLGYSVKGIDISEVGIKQLNEIAETEELNVIGEVDDYNAISNVDDFDIVLMNSMFHFYKNDRDEEKKKLVSILSKIKPEARLILVIQENKPRINYVKKALNQSNIDLIIEYEEIFLYKEFNSMFHMIVVQRMEG